MRMALAISSLRVLSHVVGPHQVIGPSDSISTQDSLPKKPWLRDVSTAAQFALTTPPNSLSVALAETNASGHSYTRISAGSLSREVEYP